MASFALLEIINGFRKLLCPRDKWYLLGLVILLCIGAAMEIAGLGLLLPLVAAFTKPELLEQNTLLCFFRQLFSWADEKQFLLICCCCIVCMYTVKNLWILFTVHIYASFTYGRLVEINSRLYSTFLSARYHIFADHGKVELQTVINKVEQLGNMVLLPGMIVLVDLLTIIFITLLLLFTIPLVVIECTLIFGIGSLLIYFPLRKVNFKIGKELNDVITRINKICYYSFEDIKSIKVLGLENFFSAKFDRVRKKRGDLEKRFYTCGQIPRLFLETLAVISAILVFIIMLYNGEDTGSVILSFSLLIAAMSRLLPAISRIHYSLNTMSGGHAIFRDIIAASQWEKEDLGTSGEKLNFNDTLRVENVSFSYPGNERTVIDNLSFELKRNSSMAVIGPTGGGKSTLIDLLLGLQLPSAGRITVDGRDIRSSLGAWRKLIGFVPQFIVLADDSIAANVALGCSDEERNRDRVREVLRIAQLEEFVDSLPQGMDTVIGDNGIRLSGGQRQRLGIARALYRDPEIIIFDEATSALDSETEQALIDALDGLYGEKTLIMVAHRLSTVEKCGKRIEIRGSAEHL
ncbi:MAG: ABC transporter ATP-binding protein [Lentisphaeria bacterium]|nr:ABC transporter ATP-binding protein [Lentisphaeria bacterium]